MFSSFRRHSDKPLPMTPEDLSFAIFLPEDVTFDKTKPFVKGGYGDLFKGHHSHKGILALKRLRHQIVEDSDPRATKRVSSRRLVLSLAVPFSSGLTRALLYSREAPASQRLRYGVNFSTLTYYRFLVS